MAGRFSFNCGGIPGTSTLKGGLKTDTELATHLDADGQDLIAAMNDQIGALTATDIADVVTFAVSRRRELNLRQIIALPTRQA